MDRSLGKSSRKRFFFLNLVLVFPNLYVYKQLLWISKILKIAPSNAYRIWCAFLFCFDAFLILEFNNGIFSPINFPRRIEKAFLQFSLARKPYTPHILTMNWSNFWRSIIWKFLYLCSHEIFCTKFQIFSMNIS